MRTVRLSLKNPEMNIIEIIMPSCRAELDAIINGSYINFSGRTIVVTQAESPVITNPLELEFCSMIPHLILTDIEERIVVQQVPVFKDPLPECTTLVTPESIDRYLFDHPLEPSLLAVLEKHGYCQKSDVVFPTKSCSVKPVKSSVSSIDNDFTDANKNLDGLPTVKTEAKQEPVMMV